MLFRWCAILALSLGPACSAPISFLNWNVAGNGASEWTTNTIQVQAIGRVVMHLQPDIIAFQEIPHVHVAQMTNFVKAFLPGYHLARASGTDGNIRSVIASRYPINREQKWLDGVPLNAFGYDGNFTRDLFEAEIAVPGWPQPLHVFTTHLKATFDAASVARRAAEALAISNFIAQTYYPTWGSHPFLVSGDMNEDHVIHANSGGRVIQKLTHPALDLRLTTPTHPFTGSERTFSIRSSLQSRLDYILPNGLLYSNIVSSQTFRTGVLNPLPPGLLADDDRTASDHLGVFMVFGNPYEQSFEVTRLEFVGEFLSLRWEAEPGRRYNIESSPNLTSWTNAVTNLLAGGSTGLWNTSLPDGNRFYRVRQNP